MAMKSADQLNRLLSILFLISLFGCASSDLKKESKVISKKISPKVFVETMDYIPKRSVDEKTSQLLPYEISDNPYLKKTGRIDGVLVTEFIAARRAYQNGLYKKSKEILGRLTTKANTFSGPWVMLGDIARKNKKPQEAIKNYTKAIEINKNNVNAYMRLAKTQRQQGDFIAAQNTYKSALVIWKDFPEAHLNLSILYDLYLNKPIMSQRHLEAYLFLTDGRGKKYVRWLKEIRQRTGKDIQLKVDVKKAVSEEAS